MAHRPSWSNCNCTNMIIYLLGNFLEETATITGVLGDISTMRFISVAQLIN